MAFGLSFIIGPMSHILVMLYAPFESFKAIITEGGEDDKHWLTFWSVYMLFNVLEEFGLRYVVEFVVIMGQSFYFELKFAAIIWLMFFNGATTIFDTFIEPAMGKYQKKVDEAIEKAAELAEEFRNTKTSEKDDFIKKHGMEVYNICVKKAGLEGKSA